MMAAVALLALAAGSARAAGPPPLEDYGKLPAAEQMTLSPDGQKVAFLGYADGKRIIVISKLGGAQLAAFNAGDQKVREIDWLDDVHVLVLVSTFINTANDYETAYGNFAEAVIVNAATGKALIVFHGVRKVSEFIQGYFGHSAQGGHSYGYFGGQTLKGTGGTMANFDQQSYLLTADSTVDLYQVDLDTGEPRILQAGDRRFDTSWQVDGAGRIAARDDYEHGSGNHSIFIGSGPMVIKDPLGDAGLVSLGRTADTALVQVVDGDGGWKLMEFTRGGEHGGSAVFGDRRPHLLYDKEGLLIGGVVQGERPVTTLFDPARQARFDAAARAFKGERVTLESATDNFDRMILFTEGDGDSGTHFLVDIPNHSASAIGWSYPTIMQDAVAPVRLVHYKAADGLELDGVLTLPPGRDAKNLPVVVMPHGGPQARDTPGFDWWAQAFASRGYAVFQPNFRGSDGYGRAFREAGFGQWGRKMQTDVSDGLAELSRQGIVDPKRACIVGGSYGGYVALAGVTLQHGLYRCAVADAPVSDLTTMVNLAEHANHSSNLESRYWRAFMGATNAADPILRELSPAHHAAEADAPILLIHGKQDTTVLPEQSAIMRRALGSAGKPFEFVEMAGEDHYLSKAATRTQMLQASVAFVQKYNPAN
jgi:dipeptidyl aminopeptidase/acylaminoacyl peptidase